MFETYIPGFSNMLMNSGMMTFQPELTGGGPAYTTITPDAVPEPAEGPAPVAMTPQEEFQARVRQIEAMARAQAEAQARAKAPGGVAPLDVPIMREIKSPVLDPLMPVAKAPGGVAPLDVPIMREIKSPSPDFTNMLMRPELTGGGPAMVDFSPYAMPTPAEPTPTFMPEVPAATPPSIRPSPSAPPMMSAPSTYVPGFTNMLMRPDLLEGGPAYADMMLGTMGGAIDQMSLLPFAPVAAKASSGPAPLDVPIMREIKSSSPAPLTPVAKAPSGPAPLETPIMREIKSPSPDPLTPTAPATVSTVTPGMEQFQLSDEMIRNALSTMPGAALAAPSPYARPTLNPSLDFQTQGDQQGYFFVTNRGRAAKTKANPTAFVAVNPNAQYRLVNERGKNAIVASGVGEGGLQSAYQTAQRLSKEQGKKADWKLEVFDPAVGRWVVKADDDPKGNVLGKIADIALPIAASFIPGVGPVLGAALGSAASSVAQGRSLKNTLLRAGLSAATAGTMQATGADKALSGALGKVFAPAAAEAAKTGAQKAAEAGLNEIIVSGSRSVLPSILSSGASGALSGQLASMAPGRGANFGDRVFQQPTTPAVQVPSPLDTVAGNPITVLANRVPTGGALPFATAGAGALAQAGYDMLPDSVRQQIEQRRAEQEPENEIVVRPTDTFEEAFAPLLPPNVGALNIPENEIVVTAPERAPTSFDETVTPPLTPTLPDLTNTPVDVQGPERDLIDRLRDRIQGLDAVDYLRLAGVLLPLLDGGGGGGRASRTLPGGMFGGSSIFSGGLPRATLPGASTGFAPRPASTLRPQTTQDYYRYGYGPSQSFFSYVPEGERNLSQAYTGYAHGGMAEGGDTFAVNGPGTGRSDEIPAMLSDGEYVIDAETVALLGDGSSKAGAERLDQFRANVRKHKGRHLAKGDFSVNAKRPEKYLKGGRA